MLAETPIISQGAVTPKPTTFGNHIPLNIHREAPESKLEHKSEAEFYRMRLSPTRSVPKMVTVN